MKTLYGDASVEFAYELRKMGEMALRIGDLRSCIDATKQSKKILETCYSSRHRDVIELSETLKDLEILEKSNYF